MEHENTAAITHTLTHLQKETVDRLRKKINSFQHLLDISHHITILELDKVLPLIMTSFLNLTCLHRGFLMLYDSLKNLQIKVTVRCNEEQITHSQSEISEKIAKSAAESRQLIYIDDMNKSNFKDNVSVVSLGIVAIICIPLKIRDQIIGVLYADTNEYNHNLSVNDMDIYEAFGAQAALALENAQLYEKLKQDFRLLQKTTSSQYQFKNVVATSTAMDRVLKLVRQVLNNDIPVLLQGETGVGKDLIAQTIHFNSHRNDQRFVIQNCGALPDSLLESELFGHRKGAFTGASENKIGIFEAAEGGTVFLDEISEASPALQVRLLRLLENGVVRRVGETIDRPVHVRIVAASNVDLLQAVEKGSFREDLYYRLAAFPIHIPTLRERKDDLPELVDYLIRHFNDMLHKNITTVPTEIMDYILARNWPGNVRELKNFIYRLMVSTPSGDTLQSSELSMSLTTAADKHEGGVEQFEHIKTLEEMEKDYIRYVLEYTKGNKAHAAKHLGLNRTTLLARMNKFGMESD
jgi:Nif-specific regulatory protein